MCKSVVFVLVAILALLMAGCCDNQEVFKKIGDSMNAINAQVAPLYGPAVEGNTEAQTAVAAALMAPAIADSVQKQWCPAPTDPGVKALENLAKAVEVTNKSLRKKGVIKQ